MGRVIERFGPIALASIALVLCVICHAPISIEFASGAWRSEALYAAVFNWSAIQTGFVFGVYGFVAGKKDGFLGELRNTRFMETFTSYVRRATYVGFVLSILSLPLTVVNPNIGSGDGNVFLVAAGIFAIFVWAFASFLRVALIFGQLVSVKDKTLLPA